MITYGAKIVVLDEMGKGNVENVDGGMGLMGLMGLMGGAGFTEMGRG